jgi:hypothetical protein
MVLYVSFYRVYGSNIYEDRDHKKLQYEFEEEKSFQVVPTTIVSNNCFEVLLSHGDSTCYPGAPECHR